MKFTCNTKPIVKGLDLGIISSNVTKFYQKSCIVELNIEGDSLRVNTEASSIKSELKFVGKASGEGASHTFVDSMLFKNLLNTIDSDVIEFELKEDGLTVWSGKSKFNLPQVVSVDDIELSRPQQVDEPAEVIGIDINKWNFIKNNQLYALAMSFVHPIYRNIWLGERGDVIAGDFDNSIFTHSDKAQLNTTCLIPDTIVNLLTTVPENSQIIQLGRNYEVRVETDPFTYVCEFSPKYEDDPDIGDYNSEVILNLFDVASEGISLEVSKISKYITQAELFASNNDEVIHLAVQDNTFSLKTENVDCKLSVENPFTDFECTFKISLLKDLLSHMDEDVIRIKPLIQSDEVSGIVAWTDNMEVVLAGVE